MLCIQVPWSNDVARLSTILPPAHAPATPFSGGNALASVAAFKVIRMISSSCPLGVLVIEVENGSQSGLCTGCC